MDKLTAAFLSTVFAGVILLILNIWYEPRNFFYPSVQIVILLMWQCLGSHHSQVIKGEKYSG